MSSHLIKYDKTLVLPPALCGSIGYYALMASHRDVVIDRYCRYDKRRKLMHRYDIADVNGRLTLTIPIVKPHFGTGATWNEAGVSAHGAWWNIHKVALWSAYGRTPFFEYYIDELMPYLQPRDGIQPESLMDLNMGIDAVIRRIAGIESNIRYELTPEEKEQLKKADIQTPPASQATSPKTGEDCSNETLQQKQCSPLLGELSLATEGYSNNQTPTSIKDHRNDDFNLATPVEYYQVRAEQQGFIPNLTILDLIFNMGPETPLVLKKIIENNIL